VQDNCAWCGKDLGVKEPLKSTEVTKTICAGCAERLAQYRKPVLVVSRSRARLYEELLELLKDREDIQVILDRRDSTRAGPEDAGYDGPDRRQDRDRLALK
jgi:beta-phosphoglucomutase-like phosphatase (HAD superfamily)